MYVAFIRFLALQEVKFLFDRPKEGCKSVRVNPFGLSMASSSISMVGSGSGNGSGNDNGNGNGNSTQLSEKEKGSRNKRKFRADPPPPLPLVPCTDCNVHANGNANKGFIALSGMKMGHHFVESFNGNNTDVDGNGNPSATHSHSHSYNYNHNQSHNHNHSHFHNPACYATSEVCNSCKAHQEHLNSCKCSALLNGGKEVQSDNRETGYGYEEFSSGERLQEERELEELQEADWNDNTESELEGLLLSNLDTTYKSAIKKIVASGYTEDMALKAVLKHGKCYGSKDILSNIVDNALVYLSNTHEVDGKDLYFEDLQQLEKYILAEMVCVLREVRPFFSSGDAMWCLLICDMNVAHACAMDEDALNNFNKDPIPANTPVASSVQSIPEISSSSVQSTPETSLSSLPPATNMPAFNKNAIPSHPVPPNSQVANSSMPFVTGVPTFPIQGFSMSGNMVQNTCKHDCISVSNIPEALQSGPVHPCCRMGDSKFSCSLQLGAVLSSDHFQGSSAFTAALGTEYKPGHYASEVTAEDCALSMAQPFQKAERFIYEGNKMKDNLNINHAYQKGSSGTLVSPSGPAAKVDQVETSEACLLKMASIEKGSCLTGIENSGTTYRTIPGPCIKCPGGNEVHNSSQISVDPVQTDLLMGKSIKLIEPGLSVGGSRIDPETVDDASSFVVAGAELSLSLPSSRDKEVNDSLSVAEEASDSNYDTVSLDQIFGGNGSQDRKDEIIMKMFHRARVIETQLQEWTEWAQQKVMQAARRLSKEKAELKALRQEKEEVVRLKKEKQSLEESTTKKLSEMENALRKANMQVERGNAAVHKLEEENLQLKHEMEAAKLRAIESAAACQEVSKREKKTLKKFQAWERQKAILQEELASEKRKLVSLQQQLVKAKERQLQIEVRWRQEEKSKEEAIMRATTEKQAKEQIEAATKRKEDAINQKAEMDSQRYRDDLRRLEHEITQLRFATESSKLAAMQWDSNPTVSSCLSDTNSIQVLKQTNTRLLREIAELQDLPQSVVQRERECVMCLSEERSVVFLPCAHQVVCTKCNELHGKQGMNDCPSCRTPIQQRVCVHSANF